MIDTLDFLPSGGTLRKGGMYRSKKPPNPMGTEEENRKVVDALILLVPQGTLRMSRTHG